MDRKLATTRLVANILPILGSDNLELIIIDNWKVVAKKNELKIGDYVTFCEIDSFLPIKPEYEFLRKTSYRKMFDDTEGFRLKTMHFRGQISQGLILPYVKGTNVGDDVTELLGIRKWDQPIPSCMHGVMKGAFPSFISKTDEERIQNLDIANLKGEWEITEKLDGTSCTVYKNNNSFGVCARTFELEYNQENVYWKATEHIRECLSNSTKNVAIQGEIIGPKLQSNKYKLKEAKFFVFNVYDIDNNKYMSPNDRYTFLNELKISLDNHVPILGNFTINNQSADDLLLFAEGKSKLFDIEREGLVFKKDFGSFKVVSNKFLSNEKD